MSYKLEFEAKAKKEWDRLDNIIKNALKDVLKRRLHNPVVPKDRLHGTGKHECYKIKLRSYGVRLVYTIRHEIVTLIVIGVGKRENNDIYNSIHNRLKDFDI